MSAVLSPTVNSYKRLIPGYEAPVYVGWAQVNRSALIRIPSIGPGRLRSVRAELRCPDPSSNPYLAITVMVAAALDGIEKDIVCPDPLNDINVYDLSGAERKKFGIAELPGSLAEALEALDEDPIIKNALGETVYAAFTRAKWAEWEEYITCVTDWEVERYLEVA
jgi:glutamine synthetase